MKSVDLFFTCVSRFVHSAQNKNTRLGMKSDDTRNIFIEQFRFIGITTNLYHKQKYFTAGHSLSNIDNAALAFLP